MSFHRCAYKISGEDCGVELTGYREFAMADAGFLHWGGGVATVRNEIYLGVSRGMLSLPILKF